MLICTDVRTGAGCGAENRNGARHCRQCGLPLAFALKLQDAGTLVGRYRIARVLGHGGFGAVYEAEDTHSPGLHVALKETFDPQSISSFQGEFAVLSSLDHPNLPRYYEIFEADGNGYLVMELVPGQSLADVADRRPGPLLESQVLGYALQICDVLTYLHSQDPPIIHRDIKPANIRLTPEGLIKLVDFGLLKQGLDATQNSRRGLTPGFAPLEQWGGDGRRTDRRTDIYSLGATLYRLLTGHAPASATERIAASSDPLEPPRQLNSRISAHVAEAIEIAMAPAQNDRYDDTALLKRALMGMGQPTSFSPGVARELHGHADSVVGVAYGSAGQTLASASSDGTLRVWRIADGALLATLDPEAGPLTAVAFSPDGELIACAAKDSFIRLWRAPDGRQNPAAAPVHILEGHTGEANAVAFSPDGETLASAGRDKTIRIWRIADGTLVRTLQAHTGNVKSIAYSRDGRTLASTSWDNTVRLWRVSEGGVLHILREQSRGKMLYAYIEAATLNAGIAYSPDGHTLASTRDDFLVRMWRIPSGPGAEAPSLLRTLEGHTDLVTCVAYSPDGQALVSGGRDTTIRVWRVADGRALHTLEGHTGPVQAVAYSPDGRALASGGDDRSIRLWRV